jgi:hypothetical protein
MVRRRTNIRENAAVEQYESNEMTYEATDEDLTATAGLGPILDLFVKGPLFREFCDCLPKRLSNASYDTEKFALILLAGFLVGYDCLDDLEYFHNNPLIIEKFGAIATAKAFGDWLRDFEPEHIEKLKAFVRHHAHFSRKQIDASAALVIDIDSTSHIQHGQKMEGLDYDFKGNWCLSSLSCSDEMGFSHTLDLRSGNTFSSVGAPGMIREVLSHLKHGDEKYLRADSAFCNQECIEECVRMGAKFTITAHGNTGWENKIGLITEWKEWEWTREELEAFMEKGVKPPIIDLGSFVYQPGWSDLLRFYIIVKRTWKYDPQLKQDRWYYYGVLTNFDLFKNTLQSVMVFHHKRGSAENVIREHKYNFDLKHFPCKKLKANEVYGLFALIAHNHLRTVALIDNREIPLYAKRLRFKFIFHPGRIVTHARRQILKLATRVKKEMDAMVTAWAATRTTVLARVTSQI